MILIIILTIIIVLLILTTLVLYFTNKEVFKKYFNSTYILILILMIILNVFSINKYISNYFLHKIPTHYIIEEIILDEDGLTYYENNNGIKSHDVEEVKKANLYYTHYYKEGQEINLSLKKSAVNMSTFYSIDTITYTNKGSYQLEQSVNIGHSLSSYKLIDKEITNEGIEIKKVTTLLFKFFMKANDELYNNLSYINNIKLNVYTNKSIDQLNNNFTPSYVYENEFVFKENYKFETSDLILKININDTIIYLK